MDKKPIVQCLYKPSSYSCLRINLLSIIAMTLGTAALVLGFCVHMLFKTVSIGLTNRYQLRFSRWLLRCTRTTVYAQGLENLDPNKAYLFLANHTSIMDIPILLLTLPLPTRMVSKQQLVDIPIFGKAMLAAGFVAIDRNNKERAIGQLEQAKKRIQEGVNMCIFPEGTRSKTGHLQPFKKGAFHLALDLGVPVVPVYIQGASQVVGAKSLHIHYNRSVNVYVGAPIDTSHLDKSHLAELMQKTEQAIIELSNTKILCSSNKD